MCFEKALTLNSCTYDSLNLMVYAEYCVGPSLHAERNSMEFIDKNLVPISSSRPTAAPGDLRERRDNVWL